MNIIKQYMLCYHYLTVLSIDELRRKKFYKMKLLTQTNKQTNIQISEHISEHISEQIQTYEKIGELTFDHDKSKTSAL